MDAAEPSRIDLERSRDRSLRGMARLRFRETSCERETPREDVVVMFDQERFDGFADVVVQLALVSSNPEAAHAEPDLTLADDHAVVATDGELDSVRRCLVTAGLRDNWIEHPRKVSPRAQ